MLGLAALGLAVLGLAAEAVVVVLFDAVLHNNIGYVGIL